MDTFSNTAITNQHLYLQSKAVEILKKIFNPFLRNEHTPSLSNILLAGTIRINNSHQEVHWSDDLLDFFGIPEKQEEQVTLLSFVNEVDREAVRKVLTEGGHFICSVKTTKGRDKTILGIGKPAKDPEPQGLAVTIFDITALADENSTFSPEDSSHQELFGSSLVWLNQIFENKAAGIVILNKDGKFLKANQTYQHLTGYAEKELEKLTFLNVTPKSHWDLCTQKMGKLLSGSLKSVSFEKQLITNSGEIRWVEINASLITQTHVYVLCFITDIHEKKLAEEKLIWRDEQLHQAESVAKIGSWTCDLSTRKITWSKGMYNLMEIPLDFQPDVESVIDIIHPEDRELFINNINGDTEVKDLEIRHLTPGGIKHILINSKIGYEEGLPVSYHGTCQDISEQWSERTRHELVQRTANLGWWETDLITGKSIWSDSMYEMFGLDKDTTTPGFEAYYKTLHPDDVELITASMSSPDLLRSGWYNEEMRHVMPDGSIKYFLVSGSCIMDGDRPVKMVGTQMDITSSKEVQAKLEEVQKIARFGWWEIDLITWEPKWSDAIYDIMEIDKAEGPLPFEKYVQHLHPDDRPWLYQDLQNLKDGWVNKELRYLRKNGGITYVLTSGRIIFNKEVPVKIIGTNMDITPTKEAQLKLEEAQKMARLGWWEFDLTGQNNHRYSSEWLEIFDVSGPDEIITADDFFALVHPDDVERAKTTYQQAFETRSWNNLVIRVKKNGGGYKYVSSNATIDFLEDKPLRLFGSAYDVTDFKEIEMQLEKNLINLEAMVSSMDNLIIIIDDQFRYRDVFCKDSSKLGFDPQELVGKQADQVLAEQFKADELIKTYSNLDLSVQDLLQMALEGAHIPPIQYKLSPEQEYWWEIHIHSFPGQDGKRWIAFVVNDVTARKNAEDELLKSIQKEKELTEMRSQFVSMASHQFRTPLTVIKANMQLLELAKVDDPVVNKVKRRLQSEVDRLVSLMEDIMAMGKVQSKSVQTNFQPVNVRSLVRQVKLSVENQQPDGRTLSIKVTGEERLVNLDIQFIQQALQNLIENAFKYSTNSSNPEVHLAYGKDKLRISIIDQGIGIPKEDHAKLFNAFHRGSNSQHLPGTGLGLAVTKEFVCLNNGTIFLNTKRKSGTEFCIDLPFNDE